MIPAIQQNAPIHDTPARVVIQGNKDAGVAWPGRREGLAWGILITVAVLSLLGIVGWRLASRGKKHAALPPDERAFLDLARRLGLGEAARAELRRLGAAAGVHPAALLASASALRGALAAHGSADGARAGVHKELEALAASA